MPKCLAPLALSAERLEQLLGRHAVLGIARVVHNAVRDFEKATGGYNGS